MKHRRVRRAKPFVRRKGRAARSAAGHHRYAQQAFAAGRADRLAGRPENRFYTAGPYASSYRLGVHARAANPRRNPDKGTQAFLDAERARRHASIRTAVRKSTHPPVGKGTQAFLDAERARRHAAIRAARRGTNPRRKKQTRRPFKGKTVTTVSHSKVVRRTNPRHVLYATKPGHPRLKYLGHGKFGEQGRAQLFGSVAEGNAVGRALREAFPAVLRGWTAKAQ